MPGYAGPGVKTFKHCKVLILTGIRVTGGLLLLVLELLLLVLELLLDLVSLLLVLGHLQGFLRHDGG